MNNSFKGLRHYIDIIQEATAPAVAPAIANAAAAPATPAAAPAGATSSGSANPWEGKDPAKAAAWAKLTPEDQKWLGMADPTDTIILQRAPKKGAAAPAAAPATPAAAPAPTGSAANGVNAAGQNVTMPDGTNPETGEKTTPAADNSGAAPAASTNFDSMPFGQAFKTAQAQGLKQFNWKGKPYAVQTAKPQAAKPAKPAVTNPGTTNPQGMDFSQMSAESVGYSEDQTLARIVELAKR